MHRSMLRNTDRCYRSMVSRQSITWWRMPARGPVSGAVIDVWHVSPVGKYSGDDSTNEDIALIDEARGKAGIVLNMVKPRSGITREVAELLQTMETPLLNTRIHDRVSIARSSMTSGILKGGDAKATAEFMALAEEVVDKIAS